MRPTRFASLGTIGTLLSALQQVYGVDTWNVQWPDTTAQCENLEVRITGGVPPWSFVIVPVGQQPIFWSFSGTGGPVNASYPAVATVPLQLEAGTAYSVISADSRDWNRALFNPTTVQVVQPSNDTSCFASAQPAHKDFSFQVYGRAAECQQSFGITWTTTVGVGPYSFTVIPMDGSYAPWNVLAAEAGSLVNDVAWTPNMTAGTRFTIYMNDGYGLGRGGVGQIWEVAAGNDPANTCITGDYNGRGTWPDAVSVATLQASPTPFNSTQTTSGSGPVSTGDNANTGSSTPTTSAGAVGSSSASGGNGSDGSNQGNGTSSNGGGLSKGAIAGIAVGAAVGVAILVLVAVLLLRRRKRSAAARSGVEKPPGASPGAVDLFSDGGHGEDGEVEGKVEPYRAEGMGMPVPIATGSRGVDRNSTYSSNGRQQHALAQLDNDGPGSGSGFAGIGSGEQARSPLAGGSAPGSNTSPTATTAGHSKAYEALQPLARDTSSRDFNPSPTSPTNSFHQSPPGGGGGGGGGGASSPVRPLSSSGSGSIHALGPSVGAVAHSASSSSDRDRDKDLKRPLPRPPTGSIGSSERALPAIPTSPSAGEVGTGNAGNAGNTGEAGEELEHRERTPEFRRHVDSEYVDLPPLYTDVPKRREQGEQ